MGRNTDIAVIGAGPYGLSLAAYLSNANADFRVFGKPMQTWLTAMPKGMLLKSEGFASSLFDPEGKLPLGVYCAENKLPYADIGLPVPLATFAAYGQEFQRRLAPQLEPQLVTQLAKSGDGFELTLEDGERFTARRVVVASGIREFGFLPPELRGMPSDLVTHSSDHGDLSRFAGRSVAVLGAGASAIDVAAILRAEKAEPTIVARASRIAYQDPPGKRSLAEQIRRPMTGIGPSWKSVLSTEAPLVVHALPETWRVNFVKRHLGPAPGWFVREQVEGHIPTLLRSSVAAADAKDGKCVLTIAPEDGPRRSLAVDHVIAATGYRVDLTKLGFIDDEILRTLKYVDQSPALSSSFESSMSGLYFVGAPAAFSFGPLLRFAYGAGFTTRRLFRRLAGDGMKTVAGRGEQAKQAAAA